MRSTKERDPRKSDGGNDSKRTSNRNHGKRDILNKERHKYGYGEIKK